MLRIAVSMLLGDRAKYASLVCGLAFAVLLIAQQGAIFLGLMIQSTGPLQNVVQPDLWVADPHVKFISETRNLSELDLSRVRSVPGVEWAEPFFNARAVAELPDGNFRAVNIVGIDRTTMVGRPPEVTFGRLEDLRIPDAVFIEESSKDRMRFLAPDGARRAPVVGDTFKLNDRRAVVVGFCRAKTGWDSPAMLYTTYSNATSFVPLGRNTISYILVKVKAEASIPAVQAEINRAGPELLALTPEELRRRSINFIMKETGIGLNFGITVLLGVFVGLAVSAAIFYQFTVENLKYFAVLKAMGTTQRTMVGIILVQAIFVGVVGYGIGVGGAGLFSLLGRRPGAELAAYFPWQLLIGALVGMVVCVSVGALLSLLRVLRLEPGMVFR